MSSIENPTWNDALLDSFIGVESAVGDAISDEIQDSDCPERDREANGNLYSNIYTYCSREV